PAACLAGPIFNLLICAGPRGGALSARGIAGETRTEAVRRDHSMMMRRPFAPGFSPAFQVAKCLGRGGRSHRERRWSRVHTLLDDRRPTRYETRKTPAPVRWAELVRGSSIVRVLHY
ncbi:MAG: hypothetical protein ACLQDI_15040, partial [Syntrophobacteraceae bacterium]